MLRIRRFLPKDPYHVILFGLPWLLLALNPNWPFGNGACLDPWLYWTHYRTYPAFQIVRPSYYGERLPMILPGYVFHHLFTSILAEVLLHVTLFYVAVYSLYYIIKVVRDRRTALLTATLLGCHSFFIGAIGYDYIDGYGIAYYLLAVAFVTRALGEGSPKQWLSFAGAASAGCFYTNPIWLLFLPFFAVYYAVPRWSNPQQTLWSELAVFAKYFVIGFFGLTVLFGFISHYFVGTFFFYRVSLTIMFTLNRYPEWTSRGLAWMASAPWLVFPTIAFVASIAYILRAWFLATLAYFARTRNTADQSGQILVPLLLANFVYCFLVMCYMAFIKKNRVLEIDFYANVLIPSTFLALGAGVIALPKGVGLNDFLKTLATAAGICLLPLWLRWRYTELPGVLPFIQPQSSLLRYYLLIPVAVGSAALLLKVWLPEQGRIWRLAVLTFSLVGFGLVPATTGVIWWRPYHGPALFSRVARAFDLVRMQTGHDLKRLPFIWYSAAAANAYDYHALSPTLMCGIGYDTTFPNLAAPTTRIPPDATLLLLSENKDVSGAAESALQHIGLTGKLISQARVADNKVSYWLSLLQLSKLDSSLAARP